MQEGFLMSNVSLEFLNNAVPLDDDDMDELFIQMLHTNPPATMVENILKAVATLPQPKALSGWSGFDFFVADDDFEQFS
jgi:hypothetical protein